MTLAEYDKRHAALTEVWRALHRATDTPESAAAARGLAAAVRALGAYALLDAKDAAATRRAEADSAAADLLNRLCAESILERDDVECLRALSAHVKKVVGFGAYSEELDRAGVNLVSRGLPALWRVVNVLQEDLRRGRPRAFYMRRARRWGAGALAVFAVWFAWQTVLVVTGWLRDDGWRVTYFYGIGLKRPLAVRGEPVLSRDYGVRAPAFPIRRDRWSARWEGRLKVPAPGEYTFVVQGDDGYRLYIDGNLVADRWRDQTWRASMSKVTLQLESGEIPIVLEHYDHKDEAAIRIRWAGGPIPRDTPLGAPHIRKPARPPS
jgi:hypothetical protein